MALKIHSDKPQCLERERILDIPIADRFAEAVGRWIDTLPFGANKVTIATLLVLFLQGDIYPRFFIECIGQCSRYIVNGYICTLIITGFVADLVAQRFRARFVIQISGGPTVSSVSPFPQISGEGEGNGHTGVLNTSIQ